VPLDPDIKQMLDLLASFNAPPMSQGDPETARRNFRFLAVESRQPQHVVPVAAVEDLKIDGPAGPMAVRVYRPEGEASHPTVAFFHGGGFVIGDIDTHDNQCRWLCRETGAVVASFDYRLAPEAAGPAAVEDCLAGTRWAAENIDRLGGDATRLAVAGDSAGGNLAAVVAQQLRDQGGPPLAAQLLIYPATDLVNDQGETYRSRLDNAEGYFLTVDDMLWFSGHYVGDADPTHPRLSPLRGSADGLPPAVVATAEFDPLRDEGDAYAEALRAAGVRVTARCYPGMIHGFFDLPGLSKGAEAAVRQVCADFAELLS
jgi:acetyl esterase